MQNITAPERCKITWMHFALKEANAFLQSLQILFVVAA
jgi:hypothetical protein